MSEWKQHTLSEVGILQRGKSKHRPRYAFHLYGGKYPFIQTGEIREALKYIISYNQTYSEAGLAQSKLWNKGTLCITIAANIAEIAILQFDACFPDSVIGFVPDKEKTNVDFVFYTLKYFQKELQQMGDGSVQDNINLGTFEQIKFPFPPLPIQTAIAEILSSLDDKIDLLHQNNKTLEAMAETIFRKESEKWKTKSEKLGYFIETTLGGEWGKENAEGEFSKQVCCIRGTDIADLQNGLAERTPIRFVKEKKFENIEPKNGDIILEISGGTEDQSTGRTIYIDELNRKLFPYPLVFSNFCRLIRPKKKEYSYFLYLQLQSLYKQDEFFNIENGSSGIKNLDYKYLLFEMEFSLPTNEKDILKFNDEVSIYFEKINQNKHQIRTLTQLRDTLLPKLMSGEISLNYDF